MWVHFDLSNVSFFFFFFFFFFKDCLFLLVWYVCVCVWYIDSCINITIYGVGWVGWNCCPYVISECNQEHYWICLLRGIITLFQFHMSIFFSLSLTPNHILSVYSPPHTSKFPIFISSLHKSFSLKTFFCPLPVLLVLEMDHFVTCRTSFFWLLF